jgi:hypothetical protein
MVLSSQQYARQNHNLPIHNKSFKNVTKFKCLRTTATNQNWTNEEIKSRLNSGNACYHSVQNILSSCLLSKNFNIKIHKTIILSAVLYGCETWSLILREEQRLGVFENRVLRRIFGPRREEVAGGWRRLHNEELHKLYALPGIIRVMKTMGMRRMGHVTRMKGTRNAQNMLIGQPKWKRALRRSRCRWKIILRWILLKHCVRV